MSLVKITDSSYSDAYALNDVIKYGNSKCTYWDGFGVCLSGIDAVINSMRVVKEAYDKNEGKQLYHIIVSIRRDMYLKNYSEYKCKKDIENSCKKMIGAEISEFMYNLGFQNAYFLHQDGENSHIHFVVNSVSYIDGKIFTNLYGFKHQLEIYLKENYPFLQWL